MQSMISRAGWIFAGVLALLVLAALAGVARGGPLDPPGAPAPTQPQLEPRTPISVLPYTISQSGSYFVTKNLSLASGAAIFVNASNVTVDLNGFTLSGAQGDAAIADAGGADHLVVRNGTLAGWGGGIQGGNTLSNSRFEHLQIRGAALPINAQGAANVIDSVTADGVAGYGFWLGERAVLTDCQLSHAANGSNPDYGIAVGPRSTITRCTVDGFSYGIAVGNESEVVGCDIRASIDALILGAATSAEDCMITAATEIAIRAEVSDRVVHNMIDNPGSIGIFVVGAFARIEDNQIILGDNKTGILFNPGANLNTVLGNRIRRGVNTTAINVSGQTDDIAPQQSAASATSPTANIVY
jgi:hypothetical protein